MTRLSALSSLPAEAVTRRIAVIQPHQEVLYVGEVSTIDSANGRLILNEQAIKSAYPEGEIIFLTPETDVAPGDIRTPTGFVRPNTKKFVTWEFFALFTPEEQARYFQSIDSGDLQVRTLAELMRLQSGSLVEGSHPVVQYGLYILRQKGILATDERMTEIGNVLQGIEATPPPSGDAA